MGETTFLCWGCGELLPRKLFATRKQRHRVWEPALRCGACAHSRDPDVRGHTLATPGLDRLLARRLPLLVEEMAEDLDTPDPTNAELASMIRKRLGEPILTMLNRAVETGDPRAITAALKALALFEEGGGEGGPSWLLDSPAGATDSE